jgi:hypothetical protein
MNKIPVPKEFALELNDLFRHLGHEKHKGNLSPSTLDALARVLSWIPHLEIIEQKNLSRRGA